MNLFRKTIILDVSTLPEDYKYRSTLKEGIAAYEKDFKVKVIPVDYSRANTMGQSFIPIKV